MIKNNDIYKLFDKLIVLFFAYQKSFFITYYVQ